MSVSVRDLLDLPGLGLEVVAGSAGLDRTIRVVHTSELQDPTPWLSGGEFLLTTGMDLDASPQAQRAYVRRLTGAGLAGLGFGVGFGFDAVPPALARAAERAGFPVLEVPYPVPFIAIAEAVARRLAQEQLRQAQLSVEVYERLASLVAEGSGPADVLDEVTSMAGGWMILFDPRGEVLARSAAGGGPDPRQVWTNLPAAFVERRGPLTTSDAGPDGSTIGLMVMAGKRHEGVLVFGKPDRIDQRDRLVVHHAVTVLGLLLASRRALIQAERRVAGDILSEAFAGRLSGSDLERRLELIGFAPAAPLTVIVIEASQVIDAGVLEELAWSVDSVLGARSRTVRTTIIGRRIASVVAHPEPAELAEGLVAELDPIEEMSGAKDPFRIGVGESLPRASLRDSYLSAVFALRSARAGARVATPADLGSYSFFLGSSSKPALETYVRSVLGPLIERDRAKSSDLVASVRAFVESGGRWEPGAETLGVHRHTLRYRINQAEELLGRDLSSAPDQLEVWLALRALEVLEE